MKLILFLLISVTLPSFAATIEGTVRAQGKEIPASGAKDSAYQSRKFKFAEQVDYSRFRDFVVYLESDTPIKAAPPAKPLQVVTQKDAVFRPHVVPVLEGTVIEWPNQDEILHNVFSDSEPKRFDLGLYKDEVKKVTFDKSGRVDVFCSIHSKMHCIVLVLKTPYFDTSDAKGRFTIPDVPPGKYRLRAWHERMPSTSQELVIPEGSDSIKVDLVMSISGLPQY